MTVKISALTEDTAPTSDDNLALVDDISGSPTTKRASLANVTKGLDFSAPTAETPVGGDSVAFADASDSDAAKSATIDDLAQVIDRFPNVNSFSGDLTAATAHHGDVQVYTGTGGHDYDLDNGVAVGWTAVVVNKGTGDLEIDPGGSGQINGQAAGTKATVSSGAYECVTVIKLGSNDFLVKGEFA